MTGTSPTTMPFSQDVHRAMLAREDHGGVRCGDFPNPSRSGRGLLRCASSCARTGYDSEHHPSSFPRASNNSKRHSSFPRAFDSGHVDGYELHDVVQLAVGKLPDRLLHSGADSVPGRDLKRDSEYRLHNGLQFEPTRVSNRLLSTIGTNRKIMRAALPCLKPFLSALVGR